MTLFNNKDWVFAYTAVCLLFFVFLYLNSQQKITSVFEKIIVKKNLFSQIENNKKALLNAEKNKQKLNINMGNTALNESNFLDYLTHFFEKNNTTVHKIELLHTKTAAGVTILPVKINLIGQFSDITHLLIGLEKMDRPIFLNNFSLQIDSNDVMLIEMQLFVFSLVTTHPIIASLPAPMTE